MAVYLRLADVVVMNYPNVEHYARYMSPLKMFSYMASGVPIVTTDLPSVREILSDASALFFPPGDPNAFQAALRETFADPGAARARARAAQELSVRYSWEKRAERIRSFSAG